MTIGEREYERHRQTTPNGKLAESYFDLGGVRSPVCEVIDAMAEDNDRLRRELGAAKAELERLKKCLEKANANAENFEREWYLRGDALESAQSELARMRPVVEAANAWFDSAPGDDSDRCMIAIVNAVLAYRAGAGKGDEDGK